MKLLNCTRCNDIIAMTSSTVRNCMCGMSKGRYLKNGLTGIICGKYARLIGLLNQEYNISLTTPTIPFHTYYKWFPILSEKEHNVLKLSEEEFNLNID